MNTIPRIFSLFKTVGYYKTLSVLFTLLSVICHFWAKGCLYYVLYLCVISCYSIFHNFQFFCSIYPNYDKIDCVFICSRALSLSSVSLWFEKIKIQILLMKKQYKHDFRTIQYRNCFEITKLYSWYFYIFVRVFRNCLYADLIHMNVYFIFTIFKLIELKAKTTQNTLQHTTTWMYIYLLIHMTNNERQ